MTTMELTNRIEASMRAALVELVGADPDAIKRETPIEQLDVDSLDLVELRQMMLEEFDAELTRDALAEVKTLRGRGRPDRGCSAMRRVVVTGLGAVTPLGNGARTLHERWLGGVVGIEDGVGRCSEFDPTDTLSHKEARRLDRFSQMAVASAEEALAEAGWADGSAYDPYRVGCIFGTAIGGAQTWRDQIACHEAKGDDSVSVHMIPMMMPNAPSGVVAIRHGFRGPVFATASACASGAHAIGTAARAIRCGDADAVLAGGAESTIDGTAMAAFRNMGALSLKGVSRPFDARRDGFVMAEGAAAMMLEEESAAQARGAQILGEVRGYASTDDAFHITAPAADADSAGRAISGALTDAGADVADVVYVNAHGTGTPFNDVSETKAIKRALGDRAYEIPVSSTKSTIGHTIGAAGAIEAVATLLALRERTAPPTLGFEEPDPDLDLDFVTEGPAQMPAAADPVALSNSFGFGGHNVVLCMGARA